MNAFLPILLLKVTAILLGAGGLSIALRRSSASLRHAIWVSALAAVLVLPLLSLSLPPWDIYYHQHPPVPIAPVSTPVIDPSEAIKTSSIPAVSQKLSHATSFVTDAADAGTVPPSGKKLARQKTHLDWTVIAFSIWFVGALLVIGRIVWGLYLVSIAKRRSMALETSSMSLVDQVSRQMGMRRKIEVRRAQLGRPMGVPITWGMVRPVVLLPVQSKAWSEECVLAALLHEFAHIQRGDWPAFMAGQMACALYWFHPLVWLVARQMREECERACDDRVLALGVKPTDYTLRLVEVLRSLPEGPPTQPIAIAMAMPNAIEGRLKAVLAAEQNRVPITRRRLFGLAMALVLCVLPLAGLRIVAQAQQSDSSPVIVSDDNEILPDARIETLGAGIIGWYYFRDVACPNHPDRPVTVTMNSNAQGRLVCRFWDKKTGDMFRDGTQINADVVRLLAEGTRPRPGASAYTIPSLPAFSQIDQRTVYFTAAQRRRADQLRHEDNRWVQLLQTSTLILHDGDIEPNASAMSSKPPMLSLQLTPEGQVKRTMFARAHVGEYVGVLVGDKLRSLALYNGPFEGDRCDLAGASDTMTEAQTLVQQLNAPRSTQITTQSNYKVINPKGMVIESDGGAGDGVPTAAGSHIVLANGYSVAITGVTQLENINGNYVDHDGPWWIPEGRSIAAPLRIAGRSVNARFTNGHVPYWVALRVTPPKGGAAAESISEYYEMLGTDNTDGMPAFVRRENADVVSRLRIVKGIFKTGLPGCTLRYGLATGPWQTTASRLVHFTPETVKPMQGIPHAYQPVVTIKLDDRPMIGYCDLAGQIHMDYLLGPRRRLRNVARRLVAVDRAGKETTLTANGIGVPGIEYYDFAFLHDSPFAPYNPGIDLSQIKEFRVQTRPYQIVEFSGIALHPRRANEGDASFVLQTSPSPPDLAEKRLWDKKMAMCRNNMKLISRSMGQYLQDHEYKLPSLKSIAVLKKEIGPDLEFQQRMIDPSTGLPYRVQGGNLFVSPLSGKPYHFATGLSGKSLYQITRPEATLLFSDTPTKRPFDGKTWCMEAFVDLHVKGIFVNAGEKRP